MSVTLIALAKIKDKAVLGQYREQAGAALAKHGGSVTQAGPIAEVFEGEAVADTAALLSFPDLDSAHAWINDPDLESVHGLRNAAARSTIMLLG